MSKKLIKNFKEMFESIEKIKFTGFDCPIIKHKEWKENREKIKIYEVKTRKKRFGFLRQEVLVNLGKNEYGGRDYLEAILKGFLVWKFLIGKLTIEFKTV